MKKLIALALAMLLTFCCASFAEEIVAEVSYDGVWVELDFGLGLYVPSDWYISETTEEQAAAGIFAFFSNEDMSETLQVSVGALTDQSMTLESIQEGLSQIYENAAIVELPNGTMLTYADYEKGIFCAMTIDEENGLLYTLNFVPYSEEFEQLAYEIICTFGYISFE